MITIRNTDRPDEEGIKTINRAWYVKCCDETQTDLMKKGLRHAVESMAVLHLETQTDLMKKGLRRAPPTA